MSNVTVDEIVRSVTVEETTQNIIISLGGIQGAAGPTDHTLLTNIGTSTHAQLDTAKTNSENHIADSSIHFTEASIVHQNISGAGTNTHAQIDTHIANVTTNPHAVTKTNVGLSNVPNTDCTTTANIIDSVDKRFMTDAQESNLDNQSNTNTGDQASGDFDHDALVNTHNLTTDIDHDALTNYSVTEHFTEASIDHTAISNIGTKSHATLDSEVGANNAKVTNATHTGEVTGSGALTLGPTAISNRTDVAMLGTDLLLFGDTSDSNNLKKGAVQDIIDLVPTPNLGSVMTVGNTATAPFLGLTGSAGAPTYSYASDTNTGIFRSGADTMCFATGGVERLRIDNDGQLGIGTTSPDTLLHLHQAAISGRETFLKVTLADAGNDHFGISNGTGAAGEFAPSFYGYKNSDDDIYSMNFRAMTNAANDASDSSTFGLINLETYRTDSATDPNNGTFSRIENRKIFTITNGVGGSRTNPITVFPDDNVQVVGQFTFARMTTTEKNALTAVEGSAVYDTTLNKLQVRDNSAWVSLH